MCEIIDDISATKSKYGLTSTWWPEIVAKHQLDPRNQDHQSAIRYLRSAVGERATTWEARVDFARRHRTFVDDQTYAITCLVREYNHLPIDEQIANIRSRLQEMKIKRSVSDAIRNVVINSNKFVAKEKAH